MFRDDYKKANDSINTDEAYQNMLKKLNSPHKKPHYAAYGTIAAAAAMIAIVVTTGIYSSIKDEQSLNQLAHLPQNEAFSDKPQGDAEKGTTNSEKVEFEEKAPADKPTNIPTNIPTNAPLKTAKAGAKTQASAKTKKAENYSSEINTSAEATDIAVPTDSNVIYKDNDSEELNMAASENLDKERSVNGIASGGGETAVTAMQVTAPINSTLEEKNKVSYKNDFQYNTISEPKLVGTQFCESKKTFTAFSANSQNNTERVLLKEVGLLEYYDYLGKNIKKQLIIPPRFTDETKSLKTFEIDDRGNYISDEWLFKYSDGDNRIEIKTTRNTEEVQSMLDSGKYKKSTVNNTSAMIEKYGDLAFSAYILKDEIAFSIMAEGVSQAEMQNILTSLAE